MLDIDLMRHRHDLLRSCNEKDIVDTSRTGKRGQSPDSTMVRSQLNANVLINQSIRCELFQRTVRWNQNFGQCPNDHHTRSDWFWCIFKACWQDVLITRFLRTQQSSKTGIWCICSPDINKSCSLRIDCPKYTSNDGAVNMHWENSSIDYGKKRQKATSHRELGILYTLLKIFFHLQKCAFNSNERNRSPMVE